MTFHDNRGMTTTEVQSLYERRPYPHYPLLAKPRWQDGYLGSSLFARHLTDSPADPSRPRQVLSVGSGEILPYILRKWEDSAAQLTCIDLSQRSLTRAKFRCTFAGGRVNFIRDDINHWLAHKPLEHCLFDHIEAYGVIHHIPALDQTIALLSEHLAPGGTIRIMVYNAGPRDWIWQLNRVFRQMGLSYAKDSDVERARTFLCKLAKHSPRLAQHLSHMKSLDNDTRFADTFLHPWEARLKVDRWLELFQKNNLESYALYDRYAELDDLANPLWQMPKAKQLSDRANDYRYENNLEIWLRHTDAAPKQEAKTAPIPMRFKTRMPPSQWNRFPETKNLNFKTLHSLWHSWLNTIYNRPDHGAEKIIQSLPKPAAQRLARIGAILRVQAEDAGRDQELLEPMVKRVSAPEMVAGIDVNSLSTLIPLEFSGRKRDAMIGRLSEL